MLHAAAAIAPVLTATLFGGAVALANLRWYWTLAKPTFAPSAWIFGAFSLILAYALASALFRVLRRPDYLPDRSGAIRAAFVLIALNLAWSLVFFGLHSPAWGLSTCAAVLIVAVLTLRRCFGVDRGAGWRLMLCLFGFGFAGLVDLSISLLNR